MSERVIWIIICVVLAGVLVYVLSSQEAPVQAGSEAYPAELSKLESRVDSMRTVISEMENALQQQEAVPGEDQDETASETPQQADRGALMSYEIRQFQSMGLENPEEDILKDLYNNPQLIPHEGVLGGTMRFHSMDDLKLINGSWAYARYEDGHITGEMLLEYQVGRNGTITWDVIRATSL